MAPSAGSVPFTKSTKFNDLPDNLKKIFEEIEYVAIMGLSDIINYVFRSHIQGRVSISNELKQRKVGDEAIKGQDSIRAIHKVMRYQSDHSSCRATYLR